MRPITGRLAAIAAALAVAGPSTCVAARAETPDACTVPDDSELRAGASRESDGYLSHEAWAAADGPQQAIGRINDHLDSRFGVGDKSDPDRALKRGLIGSALDHYSQQVVVVVDPGLPDRHGLQRSLRAIAQAAANKPGVPRLDVKVIEACSSSADLIAAQELLGSMRWHSSASSIPFAFHVDAHTSRVHVELGTADTSVASALRTQLGELVKISFVDQSRQNGTRLDDVSPHYGGARIQTSSGQCTAGFTVILPDGKRGSVTANHCVVNGEFFANGDVDDYGQAEELPGSFPSYDMARIRPTTGQTYTNQIWTDPCCPSTRSVTGWSDPWVNQYICVSGSVTRAKCGIKVTSLSDHVCQGGCTYGLIRGEKPNYNISAQGDSGGPVYTAPTSTTATIKGMHVAGSPGVIQAEKISHIRSHLNVKVLTYA